MLRHANYGENNRMLTLLTPQGLVSASARGCRKASSRLLTATELFAAGEYMLYEKDGHHTLRGFQLQQSFYPIRTDIDKLSHGVYWLNLAEAVAQPNEDTSRLFKMMLLSLAVLAFGDLPCRPLTAVFLAQFAMLSGFAPRLDRCARCGGALSASMAYDVQAGGVCCASCVQNGIQLAPSDLLWLQEAQACGAFVLAGRRPLPQPADGAEAERAFLILRSHVEERMDRRIASGKML